MKKNNKKVMIIGGVLLLGVIVFSIYQVGGITQKKREENRIGSKRGSGNEGGYGADTLLPNGQVQTAEDLAILHSKMVDRNRTSPYSRGVTWAQQDN